MIDVLVIVGLFYFTFVFCMGGLAIALEYGDGNAMYATYFNVLDAWKEAFLSCNIFGKTLMGVFLIIMLPCGIVWTLIFSLGYIAVKIWHFGLKK